MIHHQSVLTLLAIVLALAGAVLFAVSTDNLHGSRQLQAEYAGFNALVFQVFGGQQPISGKEGK